MATALGSENMKFQNLLRFWLQGTPEASVLHNDRFLASPNPRWSTRQPSCPKPSLCDGLKGPCMIVLKFYMVHSQTTGQLILRFRNAGIKDGCRDDRLGLGKFGLSVVGDEGDTYVDSRRRLFLVKSDLGTDFLQTGHRVWSICVCMCLSCFTRLD